MKVFVTLIFAVLLEAYAKVQLNYMEVKKLGNSCPHLDSCGHQRSSGSRELYSIKERNCACDYLCHEYGDCCIDAPGIQVSERLTDYTCYELKQFGGVFMIDSCLTDYEGPDDVRYQCETAILEDLSDPLGVMPVTDSLTGTTYKNYYCSMCNYKTENIVVWTPRLECPTLTLFESAKNISQEYVFNNIASSGSSWGLYLSGENGSLFFHDCEVDPVMPMLLESKIRLCKTELISNCPDDWKDDITRTLCTSYMGARFIHGGDKYRNAHCAICNGVNTTHLSCKSPELREMTFFRQFETHAFSLLLDINEGRGQEVGKIKICKNDEIFDPFFKICRSLACLPGYMKKGEECVPRGLPIEDTEETTHSSGSGEGPSITVGPEVIDINSVNDLHSNLRYFPVPENLENDTFDNMSGKSFNLSDANFNHLQKEIDILQNCLLISLTAEDYITLPNNSIYVPKYNKTYEPTSYHSVDGSVLVCSHLAPENNQKFLPTMGYITIIGIAISMICLVLHSIIFCLVPELQNLAGRNLVSQCMALLGAYISFLIGSNDSLGYNACTAIAFFTFYFFQVSFFWMAVMAYDVWRTLRMATIQLRVVKGKQQRRFLCYSFIAWFSPLLLVFAVAMAEYTDLFLFEYRPGFASPSCWFRSRRSLMVFFAVPLILIAILNIFLYILSSRMVATATKSNLKMQTQSQKRSNKLYMRLAILMGLTWIIGFVASYLDNEILWYLFIVANSLQGLFIFVAFSCTSKVYNYFREKCSKSESIVHTNSTGSTNTTLSPSITKKFSSKFLQRNKNSVSKDSTAPGGSIRKVPPVA